MSALSAAEAEFLAATELLRAGLAKLAPQNGAKNGKRKAVTG